MKQIIIFLLVVIVGIMGYNQYKNYMRFNTPEADYKSEAPIDLDYHNQTTVFDYHQAMAALNNYVIEQWSLNTIDVRNPEDDDRLTKIALEEYSKRLGLVKFYEASLVQSAEYKLKGFSNADIILMEKEGLDATAYAAYLSKENLKSIFKAKIASRDLREGDKGALVFETQKILVRKGYDIPVDGVFKKATQSALKDFETKHNLFPDGQLDVLTLDYLLQ